ncbi:MAG: hypothetical protein WD766_15150 [Gemmatimonadota bacterium]
MVELEAARLDEGELSIGRGPSVESGHHEITVRQVFTARGPCRQLDAGLMRLYPGEYMLRIEAREEFPCVSDTPHIAYTALLKGLPAGTHRLSVVHVGADGRTLAQTVLEHPVVVTNSGARPS